MDPTEMANRRLVVKEALRRLSAAAQAECGRAPASAPERQFYLGVHAAAEDALHPERADAKPRDWLDREAPEFREGYAQGSNVVAAGVSTASPATIFTLPAFSPSR